MSTPLPQTSGEPAQENAARENAGDEGAATARAPWTACVLTIFPDMFPGPLGFSLAGQGLAQGAWAMQAVDIRSFALDTHASVDDTPFGGGPGMVMRPDVIDAAIDAATTSMPDAPLIYLTPRGRPLDQARVRALAAGPGVVLLCGRYEGVDERVLDARQPEEVSLGDFVLSGGEPAAIALIDACVRLLPGVVGCEASLIEESFESGLLEYPHYTRPRCWQERTVPEVLLSGHHAAIARWRHGQAETVTRQRRPDLWARYDATARLRGTGIPAAGRIGTPGGSRTGTPPRAVAGEDER